MDLMVRTKVGLIRRPPPDAVEILTRDPTSPSKAANTISTILVLLASLALLFFTAVILICPFLLLWRQTPYPNLATVSFTAFISATALLLISAYFCVLLFARYLAGYYALGDRNLPTRGLLKWTNRILLYAFVGLGLVLTGIFLFLLARELTWWTITHAGPGYIWITLQQTLSTLIP
jgi:hypothetical protein